MQVAIPQKDTGGREMKKKFIVMLTIVLTFCGLPLLVGAEDLFDGELYIYMFDDNPEPGPNLLIGRRARGVDGEESPVQNLDQLLLISGEGWDGDYYSQQSASIIFRATEDFAPGATGGEIRFRTTENGTDSARDRMRITNNGFVGIGTNFPSSILEVVAVDALPRVISTSYHSTVSGDHASGGVFTGRLFRGTRGEESPVQMDDTIAAFTGQGYNGAGVGGGSKGAMFIRAEENWTPVAQGTRIVFVTTPTGSSSPSERLRISSEGNVGIGTETPQSSLQVNGYVQLALTEGNRPPEEDCDEPSEYGRMLVDQYKSYLYICVEDGWNIMQGKKLKGKK
jgi:hypothetical protein